MQRPMFLIFNNSAFSIQHSTFSIAFKGRNLLDGRDDLLGGDEARAFELAVVALVAGAPEEVEMVEILPHVVPAGMACVVVDDAIRRVELVRGMREAADHHNRHLAAPCDPRQAAGEADEKVREAYLGKKKD